jgi:hypothetical protein
VDAGALLGPAEGHEALPATALMGLEHRVGLLRAADRGVAGQPNQVQQAAKRHGEVTPALEVGHPFARQLIPQERLQAVPGDRLEALVPGEGVQRRFGVTAEALVLGA